ncbi:MAG: MBL fold metallo-hydrolase [Methanothrix sp.]|nr:MBL fold metallo-hydrolase [Methanothrix sp.]
MEAEEIEKGVYVVGGAGISHPADCCVYLVDAGPEMVMIDAGAGPGAGSILKNVRALGFDPSRIGHLVATHCHIDHIGGIAWIREETGCLVIGHQEDRDGIELGDPRLTAADLYGIEYWPTKVDVVLEGDEEVMKLGDLEFRFVAIPGHTPGSIAVLVDLLGVRFLFGQDVHGPFSDRWGSDVGRWRRSMEKLLGLEADILCEGHAWVFRGPEVRSYIEAQLEEASAPLGRSPNRGDERL